MDLNRPMGIGVRISMVAVAVGCYFGTLLVLAHFPALDQSTTISALEWLIGTIGLGVAGDTVRPSGQRIASVPPAANAALGQPPPLQDAPTEGGK